jgi:hypothetical protein
MAAGLYSVGPKSPEGPLEKTVGIAHHVDVRCKVGKSVGYPRVIRRYGASASVVDIEGDSALDGGDAGPLPSSQNFAF